jgi:WD40 repeat protein/serine/threonine protein kinase/DNA-binding winged helix-turn-helix (wHTH) protein
MQFGVLGPLSVSGHDETIDVGGPRQRRMLAALIANSDQVVSTDRLIDIVFEGAAPDGAGTTIRSYVARLRKSLARPGIDDEPIRTKAPGYMFDSEGHTIDAVAFERLMRTGRAQLEDGDAVGAIGALSQALDVWRGEAYEEFIYEDWARAEAARLEEMRLTTAESLIEARLACGLHDQAIPELMALVTEHPVQERFRSLLVLALYRAGRQVEALRAAESYRSELVEVGLEPSSDFAALERGVASHDPGLHLAVPAGKALHGYRLGVTLGEGAHGIVYEGVQPSTGRDVAVKAMRSELVDEPGFIRRFDTEARVVSNLEHPHIVPLYDYWREPGGAYLVMRRLDRSLADELAAGPLDLHEVSILASQLGSALERAHTSGVVHGDIKSSNVLCDRDGNFYLSDFGVATLIDEESNTAPTGPSSGYRAPETISGERPTAASDQFALAVLLIQAMTGTLPFGAAGMTTPLDRPGSVHSRRSGVPLEVDHVLGRATSWEATNRFENVRALIAGFVSALTGASPTPAPAAVINPFKGLEPFAESDSDRFFGREPVVEEVIECLRAPSAFVTLIGASGSGKSSIVLAGVLPRLRAGAIPGSEEWLIASMFPGPEPFASLRAALRPISIAEPASPPARPDPTWVGTMIESALPPESSLLLVVDQFEELFTMVPDGAEREAFIEGLADLRHNPRTRVVCTLRADFYDRPLRHPELGELVKRQGITVVAMGVSDIDRAIREPAARVGVDIEPSLTSNLVATLTDEPASLPLLQFTLTELFERRRGRVITLDTYREMGGIETAVSDHAERVFARLGLSAAETARRVFLRLVSHSEEGSPTRRRLRRAQLAESSMPGLDEVLDTFGTARLLTFDRDPASREPTVELAHEALITHWPRLRRWVAEAGEGLIIQSRLGEGSLAWDGGGRDPGELLRGARLEATQTWAQDNPSSLSHLEQEYLEASLRLRDEVQAAELERVEQRERTNKRLRRMLLSVGLALLVAVVAGFVAVGQRNDASRSAAVATVRELSSASRANLESDPDLSLLLAIEAAETMQANDLYVAEAEESLHRALSGHRGILTVPNHENGLAHFSPDGSRFIALTHPTDGSILQVWDTDARSPILDLVGHEDDILDAVYDPAGGRIATTSFDGTVRLWDAVTGVMERVFDGGSSGPIIPAFSHDGTLLAANTFGGEVLVWDIATANLIMTLPPPEGFDDSEGDIGINLAFSPDDATLAAAYESNAVLGPVLWGLDDAQPIAIFEGGHQEPVIDVGFTPDGTRLVSSSDDGTVVIWDVSTGEIVSTFTGHDHEVRDLQISADGRFVASAGTPLVLVWDLQTLEVVHRLPGHSGEVDGIDISSDGRYVLSGSSADRTTRLWDISPTGVGELAGFPGSDVFPAGIDVTRTLPTGAVSFSPDGTELAATNGPGITLWDPWTGENLDGFAGLGIGTFDLAFSPDGSLILTADWEGAKLWNRETGSDSSTLLEGDTVYRAAFHPDGDRVAFVARNHGVQMWSLVTERAHQLRDYDAQAIAFSPDGSMLAVAAFFGVEVLSTETEEQIVVLPLGSVVGEQQDFVIMDLAFSPDGDTLTTVSENALGVVWDTTSWAPILRLEGHDHWILNVAYDPSREEIATASRDGTVKIWDLATGTTRLTLEGQPWAGVSYSPDGGYLAAVGEHGPVQVFILDLEELVSVGRARLTRDFTEAECVQYLHVPSCP